MHLFHFLNITLFSEKGNDAEVKKKIKKSTSIVKQEAVQDDHQSFCCRQHLPCARLQQFDNAAHVSFIGTVYYSVFISMERSTV